MPKHAIIAAALTLALGGAPSAFAKEVPTQSEVQALMKAEDYKGAVKALNSILKANPEDGASQVMLGYNYALLGKYAKAISAYEAAEALGSPTYLTQYNIACARALDGDTEGAFVALNASVDAGWSSAKHMDEDSDLDSLRDDPRFADIRLRASQAATPCRFDPAYRTLDILVGEWVVVNAHGKKVGVHTITDVQEGCAFEETWVTKMGAGQAFTWYNPMTDSWTKQWVGSRGWTVAMEGQIEDGTLTWEAENSGFRKEPMMERVVWNLAPRDDGSIEQMTYKSKDKGQTWTVSLDGLYMPTDLFEAKYPEKAAK